jgi:aspartate/methionine/tyrosine aminotransferase
MNSLAEKLNDSIIENNIYVYQMFSELGKELYYPKGILSQSAEANVKANKYNATIGIATENNQPMHFSHIQKSLPDYLPEELFPYAPPAGKEELRRKWKEKLLKDNPSIKDKMIGLPIVTNALTHGLSIASELFVDKRDTIIVPDKYWGNYNLIFNVKRQANLLTFPLFNSDGKFNTKEFKNVINSQIKKGKVIILLNFPNNPTGFTPSLEEVQQITKIIYDAAKKNLNIVTIIDDAYFGLFYENSIKESLFGFLANLHPRILPIKIDGATKENYVWGFRVGFITYASDNPLVLDALEQKTKGLIRGTISSSPHPSQTIILKSLISNDFILEKQEKYSIMQKRASRTKRVVQLNKYKKYWSYYPFNSGYFMCLKLINVDAEKLRVYLLEKYGVGTISINKKDLRIAFSCVEEQYIEDLFDIIAKGIEELS